jgi:hypothetical protein
MVKYMVIKQRNDINETRLNKEKEINKLVYVERKIILNN